MNMISHQDPSYSSRWVKGYLEVFCGGKSIGKTRVSERKTARKLFDLVVETKTPLQDLAHFHKASQEMIGADLSKMSYSEDHQHILYEGVVLLEAKLI